MRALGIESSVELYYLPLLPFHCRTPVISFLGVQVLDTRSG